MKSTKRGFTLIELMVVMAIIAVLAVLIIGAINIARQASRNTTRQSDAKTFQAALESYYSANKDYPGTADSSASVYGYSSLSTYLTNFPSHDPSYSASATTHDNRVVYCKKSSTTYNLYVVTEPTGAPASVACAVPTGAADFSVK